MTRYTQHLANLGARLAGLPAVADTFELTLTPNVQATLLLAARAAGVPPGEFIARAIVAHAQEAVGFPALSEAVLASGRPNFGKPDINDSALARAARTVPGSTPDGELTAVPDFARGDEARYRGDSPWGAAPARAPP